MFFFLFPFYSLFFRCYIILAITAAAFCQLGGPPSNNPKAEMLGECLNKAVGRILNNRKSPSRRVKEIDNRATNFYVSALLILRKFVLFICPYLMRMSFLLFHMI